MEDLFDEIIFNDSEPEWEICEEFGAPIIIYDKNGVRIIHDQQFEILTFDTNKYRIGYNPYSSLLNICTFFDWSGFYEKFTFSKYKMINKFDYKIIYSDANLINNFAEKMMNLRAFL
jgi:hypothetical protein